MRTSALVPVTAGHGRIGKEQDLVLPGGFARSVGGVGLGRGGVGGGATHGVVDLESWFSSGESQARNSWFSSGESQPRNSSNGSTVRAFMEGQKSPSSKSPSLAAQRFFRFYLAQVVPFDRLHCTADRSHNKKGPSKFYCLVAMRN